MGVEFDALGSDGCGEVEDAAGADHALELLESPEVAHGIERVAIAAKPKVLDAVQAGKRIAAFDPLRVERLHEIDLVKDDIRHRHGLRADVEYLDFPEDRERSDEAIEPRADIDVPQRLGIVDPACDYAILVKVGSQGTAAFMPFGDHRQLLAPWHELCAFHAAEGGAVAHEARPIAQRGEDSARVDAGVAEEGHGGKLKC